MQFRIRRIYDDLLPVNRQAITQVQEILRTQWSEVRAEEIEQLAAKLRDPLTARFRTILYVAESSPGQVLGFALLMHEPQLKFCFLDYLASAKGLTGGGVGSLLYERVREDARLLQAKGLFFECLPDSRECEELFAQNVARLTFYENYGARPMIDNGYQTPVAPGERCLPFVMYDDLDGGKPLRREFAQRVVRAILERKYGYMCSPAYIDAVVRSFQDDPVKLRPPRYLEAPLRTGAAPEIREPIALVWHDEHARHHIRDGGYEESPKRIEAIIRELEPTRLFARVPVRQYSEEHVLAIHDAEYVDYLRRVCESLPEGKTVYPYVFPIRNATRPPRELSVRAGYYCIDTFTPLHRQAFPAAMLAVDCTLTAADEILEGRRWSYALVRPPGHHAEQRVFGGFCYFNNAAIAAHYLSSRGRVALLDVDYHHGNGQQQIFYDRADVLTVSIHAHPNVAYPYFTGFEDERGTGAGTGFNLNLPLAEGQTGETFRVALRQALAEIERFAPTFLVVALGFDTAKGDPSGSWRLAPRDFGTNGELLAQLELPTLFVQEGGYRTRTLGVNARHFFQRFMQTAQKPSPQTRGGNGLGPAGESARRALPGDRPDE